MNAYRARIKVDRDQLSPEQEDQVSAALRSFQPSIGRSLGGLVEVRLALAAESLVEATMVAVSMVWTAIGAEPVAADVCREAVPDAS